jgi:hypothetical protein
MSAGEVHQACTCGGGGGGCWAAPPQTHPKLKFEITDFVDSMMSEVLHDLPFGRNEPLKSADD